MGREQSGFYCKPNQLFDAWAARLGPVGWLVLDAMVRYSDPEGNGQPTISRVMSATGLGAATVRRHLRRLRDLGLLSWEERAAESGSPLANSYRLEGDARRPRYTPKEAGASYHQREGGAITSDRGSYHQREEGELSPAGGGSYHPGHHPSMSQDSCTKTHAPRRDTRAPAPAPAHEAHTHAREEPAAADPRDQLSDWQRKEIARYLGAGMSRREGGWALELIADFPDLTEDWLKRAVDDARKWVATHRGGRPGGMEPLRTSLRKVVAEPAQHEDVYIDANGKAHPSLAEQHERLMRDWRTKYGSDAGNGFTGAYVHEADARPSAGTSIFGTLGAVDARPLGRGA